MGITKTVMYYVTKKMNRLVVCLPEIDLRYFNRYHAQVPFGQPKGERTAMQYIALVPEQADWVEPNKYYSWSEVAPEHSFEDKTKGFRVIYPPTAGVPVEQWKPAKFKNPETGEWV